MERESKKRAQFVRRGIIEETWGKQKRAGLAREERVLIRQSSSPLSLSSQLVNRKLGTRKLESFPVWGRCCCCLPARERVSESSDSSKKQVQTSLLANWIDSLFFILREPWREVQFLKRAKLSKESRPIPRKYFNVRTSTIHFRMHVVAFLLLFKTIERKNASYWFRA